MKNQIEALEKKGMIRNSRFVPFTQVKHVWGRGEIAVETVSIKRWGFVVMSYVNTDLFDVLQHVIGADRDSAYRLQTVETGTKAQYTKEELDRIAAKTDAKTLLLIMRNRGRFVRIVERGYNGEFEIETKIFIC